MTPHSYFSRFFLLASSALPSWSALTPSRCVSGDRLTRGRRPCESDSSQSPSIRGSRVAPALFTCAIFFALAALPARAHDPYQAWCTAVVRDDHLELTITMNPYTAQRLIPTAAKPPPITESSFADYRERLVAVAPELCTFTSGKIKHRATKAEAIYTDEEDVTFKIFYPRPPSGPMILHAAFLVKLGDDYGAIVEVADNAGNHLGWDQLTAENPNLEVTVRPRVMPKKP